MLIFFVYTIVQRLLRIEKSRSSKITRIFVKIIVYFLFFKMALFQVVQALNNISPETEYWPTWLATISNLATEIAVYIKSSALFKDNEVTNTEFTLFTSLLILDLMGLKNYQKDVANYYNETEMKNKVGTMCHLYEYNDTKLYKRMTLMMAVDNLEEHVE